MERRRAARCCRLPPAKPRRQKSRAKPQGPTLAETFWTFVERRADGHGIWVGTTCVQHRNGSTRERMQLGWGGKMLMVKRVAYRVVRGVEPPKGANLRSTCNVPRCVLHIDVCERHEHASWATVPLRSDRPARPRNATIDQDVADAIVRFCAGGGSARQAAVRWNVSRAAAWRIATGRSWKRRAA